MGYLTENEINAIRNEAEITNAQLERDKKKFEKEIVDGLGKEMDEYLSNPPKVNPKKELKFEKKRKKNEKKKKYKEDIKHLLLGY